MKIRKQLIHSITGIIIFSLLWQFLAYIASSPYIFPTPLATINSAINLLKEGYGHDLIATTYRSICGWILALLIGIPVGLILGISKTSYNLCSPIISFLRSLPAFMLITIPIALGKGGEFARLLTITFASTLIIIDECAESLLTLPQDRIDLIRVYHGSFWFILTKVLLFELLGRCIVPVARTTISICFIIAIVCESLVTPIHGIGARLLTSLSALDMTSVYAFLLLTGLTGLFLNFGIHSLARRIIYWT